MQSFDAAQTAQLLPWVPLSEEIAAVLELKATGGVRAPERLSVPLPDGGALLMMPASDGVLAVVKTISVSPANPGRGLPLIRGEVVVLRADTGERLGLLDGPEVTARRTAAASLLAAERLAPNPEGPLLVAGAGVQATAHALAFAAGLGMREVMVLARNPARAGELVERLRGVGLDARVALDPGEAVARATLVVTATNSPVPVLPENLREDVFVAAVGSFHPDRAEVPAKVVRRCRVFVDDLEAARAEAGDLILAGVDFRDVTPLEGVPVRLEMSGPVLYKAVGHAALDLAAARLAFSG